MQESNTYATRTSAPYDTSVDEMKAFIEMWVFQNFLPLKCIGNSELAPH